VRNEGNDDLESRRCTDREFWSVTQRPAVGMSGGSSRVDALPNSKHTTCVPSLHWLSLLLDGYWMVEVT